MLSRNPLRRPFPERGFGRSAVIGAARTGGFVFVALLFFQPFLPALGYGVVTFSISVLYSYVTSELFKVNKSGPKWTLAWWIVDSAALLFFISLANFLFYNSQVGWRIFDWRVLLYISVPTVLVGLLPIAFGGMALQLRAEQENQRRAGRLQLGTLQRGAGVNYSIPIRLEAGNLELLPQDFIYAKVLAEHIRLVYFENGDVSQRTLPLYPSDLEILLDRPSIVRCHPQYLVNSDLVVSATADAQGLWLKVKGVEKRIPAVTNE